EAAAWQTRRPGGLPGGVGPAYSEGGGGGGGRGATPRREEKKSSEEADGLNGLPQRARVSDGVSILRRPGRVRSGRRRVGRRPGQPRAGWGPVGGLRRQDGPPQGSPSPCPAALIGACGGNYTAASAVIYSPDFPDAYAAGRACYWTIRVAGASRILFNFTLFDIRDAADMVELLDGYSHRVLARFDSRHRPAPAFNVSLDFVILYFFSDRLNQAQGFALVYRALHEEAPAAGPPHNQSLAEGITEQSNLSASAARASKVLYVITTSPSHPPRAG
ncbi:kremen protein 1-like, partial [Gracilinanus agilis]|uniref:kremen protein 1-like n=1 Tax=Gracilinanus agilis TaxID=191870 RepID=UPI001CFC71D7